MAVNHLGSKPLSKMILRRACIILDGIRLNAHFESVKLLTDVKSFTY